MLRLWDLQCQSLVGEPMQGHLGDINSVVFSPDGNYIYSASEDHTIRRWDAMTLKQSGHTLMGHTSGVRTVAVSPDGTRLASGGMDNTIRTWDAKAFEWDPAAAVADCDLRGPDKVPASIGDDGWIGTTDGGLLLWVPDQHRNAVLDMSSRCIGRDDRSRPIWILWDKLCHGDNWTSIRTVS